MDAHTLQKKSVSSKSDKNPQNFCSHFQKKKVSTFYVKITPLKNLSVMLRVKVTFKDV